MVSMTATPPEMRPRAWQFLFLAWTVSLAATAGALFIGEVMGMAPCVLCWYQRIAMFPLVVVLGLGLLRQDPGAVLPGVVLALAGWAVAGYHTLLYWGWIDPDVTPCGQGPSCKQAVLQLLGMFDLPVLSWIAFSLIVAALLAALKVKHHE